MTTEEIFNSTASQRMMDWNINKFQRDFPSLYHVILQSMDAFCKQEIESKETHYKEHIELLNHSHEQEMEAEKTETERWRSAYEYETDLKAKEIAELKEEIESQYRHYERVWKDLNKTCFENENTIKNKSNEIETLKYLNNSQLSEIQSLKEEVDNLKLIIHSRSGMKYLKTLEAENQILKEEVERLKEELKAWTWEDKRDTFGV